MSSIHVITSGAGRYAGASGYIHVWGNSKDGHEYVAEIRVPRQGDQPPGE